MTFWTNERVVELRGHFERGLSIRQMGAKLGGLSPGAVVGKLHRMGLKRGKLLERPDAKPPRQRRPRFAKRMFPDLPVVPLPAAPAPAVSAPTCRPIGLLELTNETCRWPLGEPVSGFCGAREADNRNGVVYCRFHSRIAYRRLGEVEA